MLGLDKKSINQAASLQVQIDDLLNKYKRKSLTPDEEATKAINDEFKKIADKVKKFNSDPKNKIKVSTGKLEEVRKLAIDDLTYRQETEKLKISLDDQKDLYRQFEEYKLNFGTQKANERFGKEIDLNKTYLQKLKDEQSKLSGKGTLSGGEQERLKFLKEQIKAEKEVQEKAYQDAYVSAMSVEEKILQARTWYVNEYDKLLKKQGSVTPDQKKQLQEQTQAKIDAVLDEAFQKSAIYEKLNEDIAYYTREQVKIQIRSLEEFLNAATGMAPELRAKLEGDLTAAKGKLGKSGSTNFNDDLKKQKALILDNLSKSKLGTSEYQKQLERLQQINAEIAKSTSAKFDKMADGLKSVSGMANELASAFEGVNSSIAESLSKIGEMAAIGGNAAGGIASFASGDIMGGITSSISAIGGIIKLIGGNREAQRKETQLYYQNVYTGEKEYARMMRARQAIQENITELTQKELAARKEMLSGQSSDAEKEYNETLARIKEGGKKARELREMSNGAVWNSMGEKGRRTIGDSMLLENASYEELEKLGLVWQNDRCCQSIVRRT